MEREEVEESLEIESFDTFVISKFEEIFLSSSFNVNACLMFEIKLEVSFVFDTVDVDIFLMNIFNFNNL